jgi:hypothetical protein
MSDDQMNDDDDFTPVPLNIVDTMRLVSDDEWRALKAERDTLRADAERYKYLRLGSNLHVCKGPDWDRLHLYGNELDNAIDAALREDKT